MSRVNCSQQDKIFPPRLGRPVTVIGAGAVGSQVVAMLTKVMDHPVTVYDADNVESHNIPMSVYRQADLARSKVDALREIVREQTGAEIKAIPRMYAGEPLHGGSVVCCVDNMEARKEIWRAAKMNPGIDLLVDTRIAEELVSVFAVRPYHPDDIAYYEHFLYPSSKANRITCGRHGIIYVSALAASVAVAALTRFWKIGKTRLHLKALAGAMEFPDQ